MKDDINFGKGNHKGKCTYLLMLIKHKDKKAWKELSEEFKTVSNEDSFEFYNKLVAIYKGETYEKSEVELTPTAPIVNEKKEEKPKAKAKPKEKKEEKKESKEADKKAKKKVAKKAAKKTAKKTAKKKVAKKAVKKTAKKTAKKKVAKKTAKKKTKKKSK